MGSSNLSCLPRREPRHAVSNFNVEFYGEHLYTHRLDSTADLLNLLSPTSLPPSRLPRETPINSPVSCSSSFPASCEDPGSAGDHRCGYVCQSPGAPVAKQHSRSLHWLAVPEVPESKGWFLLGPPRANLVQAPLPARGDCWRCSAFLGLALSLWWVSLIVENVQEREVPSLCPQNFSSAAHPGQSTGSQGSARAVLPGHPSPLAALLPCWT